MPSEIFAKDQTIEGTVKVAVAHGPTPEGKKVYLTIEGLPGWLMAMIFDSGGFRVDSMGTEGPSPHPNPWGRVTLRGDKELKFE